MSWSPDSRKIRLAKYIAYTVYGVGVSSYMTDLSVKQAKKKKREKKKNQS